MSQKAIKFLKKDPKFAKIIREVGDFEIKITRNKFQALIESIITQQLSGAAANSIIKRFRGLYGDKFPTYIDIHKTPKPKLRSSGLSNMKVEYIKGVAKHIDSGQLKMRSLSRLSDEEIISQLTQIKGIGRWTAEMFLIFSLGRLDVLPVGDLGLQKGVQLLYSMPELPKPAQIDEIGEAWRPYRTVATWYLWKSLKTFDEI